VFEVETTDIDRLVVKESDVALRLENLTFQWAGSNPLEQNIDDTKQDTVKLFGSDEGNTASFILENISMVVPRGRLVALVGRVGSGKSSLLQGVSAGLGCHADRQIIGEMMSVHGSMEVGGQMAYCQQNGEFALAPNESPSPPQLILTSLSLDTEHHAP
jgi:ABC-type transport system involved in cytochrome bd biosynthesis fused ATPase/permease subunit